MVVAVPVYSEKENSKVHQEIVFHSKRTNECIIYYYAEVLIGACFKPSFINNYSACTREMNFRPRSIYQNYWNCLVYEWNREVIILMLWKLVLSFALTSYQDLRHEQKAGDLAANTSIDKARWAIIFYEHVLAKIGLALSISTKRKNLFRPDLEFQTGVKQLISSIPTPCTRYYSTGALVPNLWHLQLHLLRTKHRWARRLF